MLDAVKDFAKDAVEELTNDNNDDPPKLMFLFVTTEIIIALWMFRFLWITSLRQIQLPDR